MLLLYPPSAIPSEPPAGIARLAGTLEANGVPCRAVDLNIEGLHHLLAQGGLEDDTWTRRAVRNRRSNIEKMRSPQLYANPSQYRKAVLELNRVIETQAHESASASLANYGDSALSPLRSRDLLIMAEHPHKSLFYGFFQKRLGQLLESYAPRHIGVSINYLSQALNGFALIGLIRKMAPETVIVAGGGLITSWMRSGDWHDPFGGLIDHCFDGCGGKPLLTLCGIDLPRPGLGLPAYHHFNGRYLSPGFVLAYDSSSGCYWNRCSFCPEKAEGADHTMLPPSLVQDELSRLQGASNPSLLHFLDCAIPPRTLRTFEEGMPGIPWYGFARITSHLADPDFCRMLRRSGCTMLKLGIESGDQGVLDRLEKGIDLGLVSRALTALDDAGIATYVYLLFGTPEEGPDEAERTLQFTLAHHQRISFLNLALFNMPKNSGEGRRLIRSPFYQGDLSLYTDFLHPLGWHRKNVRRFLDRVFRRQKPIAAILQRDPPHFSSNHAAFFGPGQAVASRPQDTRNTL